MRLDLDNIYRAGSSGAGIKKNIQGRLLWSRQPDTSRCDHGGPADHFRQISLVGGNHTRAACEAHRLRSRIAPIRREQGSSRKTCVSYMARTSSSLPPCMCTHVSHVPTLTCQSCCIRLPGATHVPAYATMLCTILQTGRRALSRASPCVMRA